MKRKITAITIALMLVILTTTTAFASTHLTYELQNIMREYNDYTLIGDATKKLTSMTQQPYSKSLRNSLTIKTVSECGQQKSTTTLLGL